MALLFQGCATRSLKTDALVKDHHDLPVSAKIKDVPFIKQTRNHCGPASLAMILESLKIKTDLDHLSSQMITPGALGTFTTDLVTTVRRQGMLAVEVNELENLLAEIAAGNPVLVFQNLGFRYFPQWHYAVALGYQLNGPDVILHSGSYKYLSTDMRFFERSWSLAGNWGIVVLPPGKLSATGTELAHASSTSGLERIGKLAEAKISYERILVRWPKSLPALIGLSNVHFSQKNIELSIKHLKLATKFHPESSIAWHNLAYVQGEAGKKQIARLSAKKALRLANPSEKLVFMENLKDYL